MSGIAASSVTIQTSAQSVPSTPSWFGEAAVTAHYLRRMPRAFGNFGARPLCSEPVRTLRPH